METKLCFFDFDGTVYVNHKVSKPNLEALLKLQKAGHKVFLNTGRSFGYTPDFAKNLIKWDGMICGSSYVSLGGEVLVKETMPTKTLAKVVKEVKKSGIFTIFEGVSEFFTLNNANYKEYGLFSHGDLKNTVNADGNEEKIINCTDVQKFSVICSPDEYIFPEIEGMWKLTMPKYQEYVLNGFDKTTGVKMIAEKLCIKRENIFAFGDSLNDRKILEYAGVSCVINHAPKQLDKIAKYRTISEEDGIAELINGVLSPMFFED